MTSRTRRVRMCALQTSAMLAAVLVADPALAQCSPDPTVASSTTTCAGTDTDGLSVTTFNTRIIVASGAIVRPGSAAAAVTSNSSSAVFQVDGLIDGGAGKAGLFVTTAAPFTTVCVDPYAGASVNYCTPGSTYTTYPSSSANISIAQGGRITGAQGILLRRDPSNTNGYVSASIDNAGTITGTAGPAILMDPSTGIGSMSITNRATGLIGGISGAVSYITNAGTIDGGNIAALASSVQGTNVINTGRIVSNGQATTLSSIGFLYVNNAADAVIGASTTAINTSGALSLVNAGTINGSVISTAGSGFSSTIDTRQGVINGDLVLGAGNDTLRARYDVATGRIASITGTIDGGAGSDTLAIGVDANAVFTRALLPTNFELLGFDLSNNAVATLAAGFTSGTGVSVSGTGALVNQAALVTNGQAVVAAFSSYGLDFTNQGSITAALGGIGLFAVGTPATVTNSGTITANGGSGVQTYTTLTNSGTITATGTGAAVIYGTLANSGTIRSTGGIGATMSGGSFSASTNDGTIVGATTGLSLSSGRLVNTGAITGGTTGVSLGYSSTLINAASGTITGGTAAVSGTGSPVVIVNAGQIVGTVNLVSPYSFDSSNDVFVDAGGTVTAAIRLGGGDDMLVLDLANIDTRPLAGAIGGVDAGAGYDTLRYRVNADASAALALTNGFEGLAYELTNAAALTLTAATPFATTIGLTGNGSVTLNGTISATDRTLIDTGILTVDQLTMGTAGPAQALTITNAGTLALTTTTQYNSYSTLAAIAAGTADVTNSGTITVANAAGRYYPAVAISGGKTVTNSGTITLTGGGTAISNARDIVNSGTITDISGTDISGTGAGAIGVTSFNTLANSGTIRVDGTAVQGGYYSAVQITNSGTIESRKATAVTLSYGSALTNETTGTISGLTAIDLSNGGTIVNRGSIIGDVAAASPYAYGSGLYIADGGTVAGNVTFGSGSDIFLQTGTTTGVSGIIDGGEGSDIFGWSRKNSDSIALDQRTGINFEADYVEALGTDTRVTLTATNRIASDLYLRGDGTIVNDATIDGAARTYLPIGTAGLAQTNGLAAFVNRGTISGGVNGAVYAFTNSGTVGAESLLSNAVYQGVSSGTLSFDNSGTIASSSGYFAASLDGYGIDALTATNSGTITGGLAVSATTLVDQTAPATIALANSGTITSTRGTALVISAGSNYYPTGPSAVTLTNGGTVTASGAGGVAAELSIYDSLDSTGSSTYAITNSGTIEATGNGLTQTYQYWDGTTYTYTSPAVGLLVNAGTNVTGTIANSGTIQATGTSAVALLVTGTALDLTNSGTIRGGTGSVLANGDRLVGTSLAGAIQSSGDADDRIVNTGAIFGSVDLGDGNDSIENRGRIEGNVLLGAGDDSFLQRADAVLVGTVDAGEGNDGLIIDATVGGAVNGDQFVNFERFTQIGSGNVTYAGTFRFDTIGVSGGDVTVAAGQVLASAGTVTITGGDASESVINAGTIAGSVDLGGGDDRVVNTGTIQGAVLLGAGNDRFVEGVGSSVAGGVDGGAGDDLYSVTLAGNRSGIGQRSNFERLSVEGSGTLALTLDQGFQSIALAGTGLDAALGGFTIGTVTGSDAAETLSVDGDVGAVSLGAGNDELTLGTMRATGLYMGGTGADLLRFTANAPVTLAGTATGFERVALAGGALTVAGTLGTSGTALTFGDGAQSVVVAAGGTLAGTIDLGAGDDSFRLAAGGTLSGTVSGGAGTDTATLELAGDRTLGADMLRDFEILNGEGSGTLTLAGTQTFERVNAATNLTVGSGASLTAAVVFGAADNRFTVAGSFAGSVDGGAGRDTILVSGGSATAPTAFGAITNVEAFGMTSGYATIAGNALLNSVDISGGRLVGLAGSTIRAAQITVRSGTTFGSAGSVIGDIAVAGTLSPGASPGTMTVTGNVSLASGSVSLFEITPTVADKLVINGGLSIASGSTLRIVAEGAIRPGTSYDLIVASNGITGSYTTIDKSASLFGFVVQRADRIQLLGQFLGDPAFNPQVTRSIDYANAAIQVQPATSTLFAALPALLTASGASNSQAFAQLTPEAYASATQMGVDQTLSLTDVARGPGFATTDREDVGLFTFAQGIAQWHTLGADRDAGTAKARSSGYGFLGGIGVGNRDWSVGAFAGYLDSRQRIGALGAATSTDGVVAGVHGRYAAGNIRIGASILYDGGDARTTRALPGTSSATGRYGLHSWASDVSVGYALAMADDWTLTPKVGVTYLRTSRDRVGEAGGPFALTVARDRHVTGFADAGVTFARSEASDAAFRPYVGFGARTRIEGKRADAVAGYAGAPLTLTALGAPRAKVTGTASAGVAYRLPSGVELFSTVEAQTGQDDHRESIATGVRLRF